MINPQQWGLIPELARAAEGGRITTQDVRQFADAAAGLLVAAFFGGFAGMVVRSIAREALGPKNKQKIRPALDLVLPATTTMTAEAIFARAKDLFGTTTSPDEAGYILPDGTMLDFSGRHYEPAAPISGPFRERMADHREIAFAWPEDESPGGFKGMKQVMNWGAIRFSTFRETVVVNLVQPPTEAQIKAIKRALWYNPDAVLVVEVDNQELDQIDYQEFTYPFTHWRAFIERTVAIGRPTGLGQRTGLAPQTSTTMMLSLPPITKRKILDLSQRAKGKKLEGGILLPVINAEIRPGPIKWGTPERIALKPPDDLEAFGVVHTHPVEEEFDNEDVSRFSHGDWARLLLQDRQLYTALASDNTALVLTKIKPVHPEMKDRIIRVSPVFAGLEMLGLSLFDDAPDEIMDFMERENLTFFTDFLKEKGISLTELRELHDDLRATIRRHTILLDDERASYFGVMVPGTPPVKERVRLFAGRRTE